ncbi:hypothetical protein L0666_09665 [Octadecabacter sp. CECT 8868]|uniref:CBU_0592 family membrane protein n=1 Tax=Octadecabacter algicola TaxID=2909342 RepID=UPI001F28F673|nr:hypothetical protein [Octadecabacter algicola]MCF2905256.1 hypothetical protein [Octadecabacter algicola]
MPPVNLTIPPVLFDIVGVVGFALYVINYALLTFHRVTSSSKVYFVINMFAAIFVLIGLTYSFNLASALIQAFWIVMSITAIIRRHRYSKTLDGQLA